MQIVPTDRHHRALRGFTMTELIVVLGVISMMVVLGANLGLKSPLSSRMRASLADSASLFEFARELAMARQSRTRVWISNDAEDPERDLRYLVVAYAEENEQTSAVDIGLAGGNDDDKTVAPVKWRVEGTAKTLNSGVFFQPIVERKTNWNMRTGTEGAGSPWYYYEFAPDGSSGDVGYVIVAGWRPVTGGDVTIPNDAMQDGFLIRRNGYLTFLKDAEQVKALIAKTQSDGDQS